MSDIDSSNFLPLGKVFGFLTKKYIGIVSEKMRTTPIADNYFALLTIGLNSGKISQQELADHLLTDKVSLVRILDSLEKEIGRAHSELQSHKTISRMPSSA